MSDVIVHRDKVLGQGRLDLICIPEFGSAYGIRYEESCMQYFVIVGSRDGAGSIFDKITSLDELGKWYKGYSQDEASKAYSKIYQFMDCRDNFAGNLHVETRVSATGAVGPR